MKTKNIKSVLKINIWQPGEKTLVGRIVEAENIPESKYFRVIDADDFFANDFFADGGLHIKCNDHSKDMVAGFISSSARECYLKELIDHIYESFHRPYVKATEADIGKGVYIDKIYDHLWNLKAITTDGRYVIEDRKDGNLLFFNKAWVKQENKVSYQSTEYPDGRVLHEFRII